jgi:hypothetical protein
MINHRLLVHSKWCKTEKKEKSEPSRVSNPGRSTKASRCVSIVNIHCSSMNSQSGSLRYNGNILRCSGLIVGGRVDNGIL